MLQTTSPILAAAASSALLAAGCVNVIELGVLKDAAGVRWPRIREGVCARLETMLRTRLGPNDLFTPLGDSAYLVTMPATDPDDVSAICTRVAFDLYTSLLGQCDLHHIQVNLALPSDDDTLVLRRLPPEKIIVLAEKAGIPPSAMRRKTGAGAQQLGDLANISVSEPGSKNVIRGVIEPQTVAAPRAEFHYVPIWSVPNAAVTSYACEPRTIFVKGRPQAVPLSQLTEPERLQLDLLALHNGFSELGRAWAMGKRFLLITLIAFDTIGTPAGRMEVVSACRDLSYDYRSYLTFMIYDVPPGVAQSRLANMVTVLRPFGRGVLATISPIDRAFSAYQGIGLRGIGYNLREFQTQAPFRQLDAEQLAQFGRRNNLSSFLWDVRDKNILKFAQDASIQHLSGPAVAPASAEPQGMLRLTWGEVLARPAVELWL